MDWISLGWVGLFFVTFLSATLLPFSSEVTVILFLANGYNPWICLGIATLGNALGGASNYWIGLQGKTDWFLKLGLTATRLTKIEKQFKKRGQFIAFFGFLPFIGDVILLVLGVFKTQIWSTLLLMTLGKGLRYSVLIYLFFLY
ncbi:MAG: YqaA family protein [Lishizhenia sp.]